MARKSDDGKPDATNLEQAGLLTVDQAAEALHCGRTKIYLLTKAKKLDTVKFGHTTLITAKSINRLLNDLVSKAG